MTKALRFFAALLLAVPLFAQAQQRAYAQPELDQMLAPVALYPDALLSQVLMAATYPDEVRAAADWSRANPGLQGDDAVRAVEYRDWDPSVKSLVAFPQLLARMAENRQWTQSLGDAFLAQEPQVMDTVQQLRRRAQAAGNLQSSEQMYVQQQEQAILILPASPQYIYVPYYDPYVVYGPWWWQAYRPVYWAPWPGYARHYRPGISAGFWWGAPVGLSFNFFFGNFDWHHRHARVAHPNAYYYRAAARSNRSLAASPQRWQPDTQRRAYFSARRGEQARQQVQVQPQVRQHEGRAPAIAERRELRVEQPQQRQQVRTQATAVPALQIQPALQAQPGVQPRHRAERDERRMERREERQAVRPQAQPTATMAAPPARELRLAPQPRPVAQPRIERREEWREARQAAQVQAPAAVQPQVRMPAAVAPQLPRAERIEQRQERRESRQEQRRERAGKG